MERKTAVLFLFLISFAVVLSVQQKALTSKYFFHDDCNQYTFSYYKLNDPQLFQDDILSEFALRYNTKGVIFVYALFGKIIDPLLLSKILPFILTFLAAFYAFLIGEKTDSIEVGFLAAVLFIMHSWTVSCFSGGHARAFAFPLLLSFIFYLIKKKHLMLSMILILQIFIYPPVAVVSMLTIFLLFFLPLLWTKNYHRDVREIKFLGILLLLALFLLCGLYLFPDDFLGPLFSFEEIINMPEFFSRGRDPHFIDSFAILHRYSIAENVIGFSPYAPPTLILFFVSFIGLFLVLIKKIKVSRVICAAGFSGMILYFISWFVFFRLFSPGRYLKFAAFIYLIFLSAATLNYIFAKLSSRTTRLLLLTILVIGVYWPFLDGNVQYYGRKGLYDFLATLSRDSLIAGHPKEMDEIPLLCKRKVLVQRELSLPYYRKYYSEISCRTRDFFRLYYSSDKNEAKAICDFYGIDYIVIDKEHFSNAYLEGGFFYHEPFNNFVKKIIFSNRDLGFLFKDIPAGKGLYEDEKFIVIGVNEKEFFL